MDRVPCSNDVRVGIQYFLLHCAKVKSEDGTEIKKPHLLACINWNEDHPHKYRIGNGIIAATVYQTFSYASFMPVLRILTQCAIVDFKNAYGLW